VITHALGDLHDTGDQGLAIRPGGYDGLLDPPDLPGEQGGDDRAHVRPAPVDGRTGNPGPPGDLGDLRARNAPVLDELRGRVQDRVVGAALGGVTT